MSLVVLGAIEVKKRTHLPGLRVFLASLRFHDPAVRIVLFNWSPENELVKELLAKYRVEEINAVEFNQEAGLPQTNGSSAVAMQNARFLEYGRWLKHNPVRVVVMTDVLDVAWQSAPMFTIDRQALTVAAEARTIGEERFNRDWVKAYWPPVIHEALLSQSIVCTGVITAGVNGALHYLDHYAHDAASRPLETLQRGYDTAVLAEYVYQSKNMASVRPWVNPFIMHLGLIAPAAVAMSNGKVVCEGMTPVIVHQYNRHPEVQAALEEKWI